MKIGFIGLGNMGAPMALNLVKAGHSVTGYDIAKITVEDVNEANSIEAAIMGMDCVITMLPNGEILREVYEEIVPLGCKNALFIDCSTVDIQSANYAHDIANKADLLTIDAPVSGGVGGAEAGTLTFMAGGTKEAFSSANPLFEIMGQKAVHCGTGGAGQVAKICNNMILGISMIGVCEAFSLGDKLGLDRQKLYDVVSTSSGSCWSLNNYCPAPGIGPTSPSDNDYAPGFASELMLKDLNLSQQAAGLVDAKTPLGEMATKIYQEFVKDGGEGSDFSAMLPWLNSKKR